MAKKKAVEFAITGLIIGIIVGVVLGFGELNWIKQSMREQRQYVVMAITLVVAGVSGLMIGANLERQIDIENIIGISTAEENLHQQGRVWIMVTSWTDTRTNETTELVTKQDENKMLCTYVNNEKSVNYNIKSGSKENVIKYHQQARNAVYKSLKDDYVVEP